VARSLTQRADYEYEELKKRDSAYERTVRYVMLRMVAVGGGELARRRVLCTELEYPEPENARVKEVIERFVAARLLVKGRDIENQEYVEPAHDVLVRGWQKLLSWKQQEQESLILQRRLTPAALEWKSQQQAKFLWNADPRLDLLKQVLNSSDNWFNTLEAEFVQLSIRKKRQNKILLWGSVAGAFVVLSGATLIAINSARDALKQSLEASVNLSEALLSSNRQLEALLEGVKAGELLKKNALLLGEASKLQVGSNLQELIFQVKEHNRFLGHGSGVLSVSFSPNGQMMASASIDGTINLWRRDGELIQTLPKQKSAVFAVSFSPNGQMLISASRKDGIKLWQRQPDGSFTLRKSIINKERIMALSVNPKNQMIATANLDVKSTIKLWSLDGKLLNTFSGHRDRVNDLSFSPDGQTLASASTDTTIKLWSLKDGKPRKTIPQGNNVFKVRFVNNQTLASSGADRTIKLWNVNSQKIRDFQERPTSAVQRLTLSPDGKTLASASKDSTVQLWSLPDGKLLQTLKGDKGTVTDVSFSPDSNTIALASNNRTVSIWKLDNNVPTLQGSSLSFSPDSQMIVTGDEDGIMKIWPRDGKWHKTVSAHKKFINQVSFSPNGQLIVTASTDNRAKLWRLDGTLLSTLSRHKNSVTSVSFSPDSKIIATASFDQSVKLWDLDGKLLKTLNAGSVVMSVSFSPNGKAIAAACDDTTVKLWRLDGTPLTPLKGHSARVLDVSFSPDGKMIASASEDEYIKLWRPNGQLIATLPGHRDHVLRVRFSPSGQTLASASRDETIRLWNLDGELLQTLQAQAEVSDVSFSPDDKTIASADIKEKIILWNLDLDNLLNRSCTWLHGYLTYSKDYLTHNQDGRRKLCNQH
jgi:WD40 repeat protein